MRILKWTILKLLDVVLAPLILPAAFLMKLLRRAGVQRMPLCRRGLSAAGVFPLVDQYYEPLINFSLLRHPLEQPRNLPGVDLNVSEQLQLLQRMTFRDELRELMNGPRSQDGTARKYVADNGYFDAGDAEFWYSLIRLNKPRQIIEIGSGNSTLVAIAALKKNSSEPGGVSCRHVCIEPYEMPWLEQSGVEVLRARVETVDQEIFRQLQAGDILFIDSSHVIRPQGDVLCEFLELLPILQPGVIVHVHDIFTPRDYPTDWVVGHVRLWAEQYLLEAYLSENARWKIIGALNFLKHDHFSALQQACPALTSTHEPASFYMQKLS